MYRNLAIYIPAFNAAKTISRVIDRIPSEIKNNVREIFVVDNFSADGTNLVVVEMREIHGMHNLEVIQNPENLGYGGSQKIAYQRCIDRGYKYVVMLHGDAQYAPELLTELIKPIIDGKADMVFGSRMTGNPLVGGMPLHRYLGNRFLTWVQNTLMGTHLSEFHSGYRLYSVDALKQVAFNRLSSDYHFDTEIIILFHRKGLRIVEQPIPTYYGDEKNYVNIWKYGINILVTTGTYFLQQRGWRISKKWLDILK